ncbi:hypothetical protein [Actinomadura sp. 9N407]|uniref:hypothetical protein n=1 Tax=Actinomadura sp. 9N407 TaxID=3375154 RepID=UPI0037ADA4FD
MSELLWGPGALLVGLGLVFCTVALYRSPTLIDFRPQLVSLSGMAALFVILIGARGTIELVTS